MHKEVLAEQTSRCLAALAGCPWLHDYYLAGGTAVALLLGHRKSVDLDFMSPRHIDTLRLRHNLEECGAFLLDEESRGTVHGTLDNVKVSFLEYRYPLLNPCLDYAGVAVASLQDLACMKVEAIAARGKKRDFFDAFAIAQKGHTLGEMLSWFEQKYKASQFNKVHIIKSLCYFDDAETDPEPILLQPVDWNSVKAFFLQESRHLIS